MEKSSRACRFYGHPSEQQRHQEWMPSLWWRQSLLSLRKTTLSTQQYNPLPGKVRQDNHIQSERNSVSFYNNTQTDTDRVYKWGLGRPMLLTEPNAWNYLRFLISLLKPYVLWSTFYFLVYLPFFFKFTGSKFFLFGYATCPYIQLQELSPKFQQEKQVK